MSSLPCPLKQITQCHDFVISHHHHHQNCSHKFLKRALRGSIISVRTAGVALEWDLWCSIAWFWIQALLPTSYLLCDFGQVTGLLWVCLTHNVALRIKWEHANGKAFSTSLTHTNHSRKVSIHVIFLGLKNTVDVDCSHEIKRRLLLGRKVMTNLDNILKSQDITFPKKVHLVKAMVFPIVMDGCESWTIKRA